MRLGATHAGSLRSTSKRHITSTPLGVGRALAKFKRLESIQDTAEFVLPLWPSLSFGFEEGAKTAVKAPRVPSQTWIGSWDTAGIHLLSDAHSLLHLHCDAVQTTGQAVPPAAFRRLLSVRSSQTNQFPAWIAPTRYLRDQTGRLFLSLDHKSVPHLLGKQLPGSLWASLVW